MNDRKTGFSLIAVLLIVAAVFLCCCVSLISCAALGIIPWARISTPPSGTMSNGEQIYTTATSQRGTPIEFDLAGGMMMRGGIVSCASCHGADGRGREVRMMMRTFSAPDIRFKTLTAPRTDEQGQPEPIFTEATIRQAITEGIDPDGAVLAWPMPRWTMSAADLDDLLDYLKSLP